MIHDFKKQAEPGIALAGKGLRSTVQVKSICPHQRREFLPFSHAQKERRKFQQKACFHLAAVVGIVKPKANCRVIKSPECKRHGFSGVAGWPRGVSPQE